MKILSYEVRHFSPNFHEFTGSKTIFAKKIFFLANIVFFSPFLVKNWRIFFCQNPFQSIIRLKKERKKKVAWTTKPLV